MEIYVARDGKQTGPFTEAQTRDMIAANFFSPDDLGWAEGADDWKPLRALMGLQKGPPPLRPSVQRAPVGPIVHRAPMGFIVQRAPVDLSVQLAPMGPSVQRPPVGKPVPRNFVPSEKSDLVVSPQRGSMTIVDWISLVITSLFSIVMAAFTTFVYLQILGIIKNPTDGPMGISHGVFLFLILVGSIAVIAAGFYLPGKFRGIGWIIYVVGTGFLPAIMIGYSAKQWKQWYHPTLIRVSHDG